MEENWHLLREKVLDIFHLIFAYTSPLKRAKETAEIILGGRNIPLYEDKRVQEACFGSFEGATLKELRERQDPFLKFFDAPEEFKKIEGCEDTRRGDRKII